MLAYLVMGMAVYCMMQSLGEMAHAVARGRLLEAYAERFVTQSPSASRWAGITGSLGPSRWRRVRGWRLDRQVLVPRQQCHALGHGLLHRR